MNTDRTTMPFARSILIAVILVIANCHAQEPVPRADLDRLQGTWTCVSSHTGLVADNVRKNDVLVISGDRISDFRSEYLMQWIGSTTDDCYYMKFRLDPTEQPKHVTMEIWVTTVDRESGKAVKEVAEGTKLEGIYEIADNKLKLCVASTTGKRPTSFALRDEYSNVVYERKPARSDRD